MPMGQVMQFRGGSIEKYDAVKEELGWDGGEGNKPEGLLGHAAGATADGFCVIEWWSSPSAWEKFFSDRLQPAFEKVGDIPQPEVSTFDVHASYPA